jgi:hypothetical protein
MLRFCPIAAGLLLVSPSWSAVLLAQDVLPTPKILVISRE